MEVIHLPRGGGKTKRLIEIADNYNGYIVAPTQKDAIRIFEMARKMKKDIHMPISFDEFIHRRYGPFCRRFYFDDLDRSLDDISRLPIIAVTLTKDDKPLATPHHR